MPRLAWMKKLASLLLLVCFVLPLSKCSAKQEVSEAPPAQDIYRYGYQMVLDSVANAGSDDALLILIAVTIVFFVPAMSLLFKERWQPLVQLGAAFPALYFLFCWMFIYSTPQIGGILATECWLFLLTVNAVTLWSAWRGKRKLPAAANAT
jgi:hypothetical protein